MKTENPYSKLPESAFWKTAVAERNPEDLSDLYSKKFDLLDSDRFAAAGSCFAQHITRHLKINGFNVIDAEPAPEEIVETEKNAQGYGLYSARFGNIYTVHQLLQLAQEVAGERVVEDLVWQRDGRFYDSLRPTVSPEGLESEQLVVEARSRHIDCVRNMFQDMTVFVFTLGLTESWRDKKTGTVFPVAPGVVAGDYCADRHEFVNFKVMEIVSAFELFVGTVNKIRGVEKPDYKILLTVSPVPLTGTAGGHHVLKASTYSKSVLRVVAENLYSDWEYIDYFPSYEIITNQAAKGEFYESNFRSVKPAGVKSVMKVFFSEHGLEVSSRSNSFSAINERPAVRTAANKNKLEVSDSYCDETLLESFIGKQEGSHSGSGHVVFLGDSHIASLKDCMIDCGLEKNFKSRCWYVPVNWLDTPWFHFDKNRFLKSLSLEQQYSGLIDLPGPEVMSSDVTLVLVGLSLMGDGIIHSMGHMHGGHADLTHGRKITPAMPLLKNSGSRFVKKRMKAYFSQQIERVRQLWDSGHYSKIILLESPDPTERCGRFRLGDEFVDSESYLQYKSLARSVLTPLLDNLPDIRVLKHADELLSPSGFSKDRYINSDKHYDIHVSGEFYIPALELLSDLVDVIDSAAALGETPSAKSSSAGVLSRLRSEFGKLANSRNR